MHNKSQGVYQQAYRTRGIQTERLVAHNAHLFHVLHEVSGYDGYQRIGAHQYGYVTLAGPLAHQFPDGLLRVAEHILLILIGGQQPDVNHAFLFPFLGHLLLHVGISLSQLFSLRLAQFFLRLIFQFCRMMEEGVVEFYHPSFRAIIRTQITRFNL